MSNQTPQSGNQMTTMNGKNSWIAPKNLDASKPLVNHDTRAGKALNDGTGEIFRGSPNDAKKNAKRVNGGGMC